MLMQQNSSSSRCGVNTVPPGVAILAARRITPPPHFCGAAAPLRRTLNRMAERQAANAASCQPVLRTLRDAGSAGGHYQLCAAV